jgi:prophage maintenance system killer protein
MEIEYPSVDDITNANKRAVELLRATKAERHEILAPKYKIEEIIEKARTTKCGIKKKAAILLIEINRKHFFASANKRHRS